MSLLKREAKAYPLVSLLQGFSQAVSQSVCSLDMLNKSWELFPRFGKAIRLAAESIKRRVGFVASADMGHAHDKHGPYGFDTASAEFDAAAIEAVKAHDLGRLLTFDQAWLKRASTDAYGQILNLHGAIEGTNFRGELLSYQVPTYFGMMCVAYEASME